MTSNQQLLLISLVQGGAFEQVNTVRADWLTSSTWFEWRGIAFACCLTRPNVALAYMSVNALVNVNPPPPHLGEMWGIYGA